MVNGKSERKARHSLLAISRFPFPVSRREQESGGRPAAPAVCCPGMEPIDTSMMELRPGASGAKDYERVAPWIWRPTSGCRGLGGCTTCSSGSKRCHRANSSRAARACVSASEPTNRHSAPASSPPPRAASARCASSSGRRGIERKAAILGWEAARVDNARG